MKPHVRFAILAVIPLGCATNAQTPQDGFMPEMGGTASDAGTAAAVGGTSSGSGGVAAIPTGGTTSTAGTGTETAGTFGTAGTLGSAGTFTTGGTFGSGGTGTAGTTTGGASGSTGVAGTASTGGVAGTASTGGSPSAGTGGTGVVVVGPYCDNQTKSPLPFTVNDGFQPSGWQGDITAISVPADAPTGCATRVAGAVGVCSTWRYTPSAVTPLWAGVAWAKMWDAQYTHPPVCLATGATKVTFQAKGAAGGEQVTFSAAGAAEVPFTLTNAWKEYSIPLTGVVYNTPADGVDSGFFWKVAPPTPAGGAVTFFVDDIQISK